MDAKEFTGYHITKKEYDVLLFLRKCPRTAKAVYRKYKPASGKQWNIWLSDLSPLYYTEPENARLLDLEGTLFLNERGETVAQAEYDRRFDMYCTRVTSIAALIISAVAVVLAA